jgi:hypothetical protein
MTGGHGSDDLLGAIAAIFGGAVVIMTAKHVLHHVFKCSLKDSTVNLTFFGITCRRLRLSELESAEVVPFAALIPFSRSFRPDLLTAEKWNGYRKSVVALHRRTGSIRRFIVSPQNPDQFVRDLTAAISSHSSYGF